jgi:hypothetical protein
MMYNKSKLYMDVNYPNKVISDIYYLDGYFIIEHTLTS